MSNEPNINELLNDFEQLEILPAARFTSFEDLRLALITYITELINTDFNKLVQLLYRLDVPEKRLKELLVDQAHNAGEIITELVITRQLQKIESRKKFKQNDQDIPDEERW
jgi:hypothetical protein